MKYILSTLTLLFFSILTIAQSNGIIFKGRVLDQSSGQPIEFATVILIHPETSENITGDATGLDGQFSISSTTADCHVKISFMGYNSQTIKEFTLDKNKVDLGDIILMEDSELLDEVVVRAEKSTTEFKLDKRVFNVGRDLSTTGASALEVLDNVPSVNVSIEGEISLRGSQGVQILINGKPSVLSEDGANALGTITADMIEKVEVITNPSAKYDAEGTSGIINIVIKKEERKGMNGSISLNTGYPHNHSLGLSLNRRTEKFNLFSQLGVGYRELPWHRRSINQDFNTGTTLISDGNEFRNETFFNLVLGTDYYINKYNVITLSGNFAYEIEDQPSRTNFSFQDDAEVTFADWFRTEETSATNPKIRYELQYKKEFPDDKDHTLMFSALGNFFGKKQSSDFLDTYNLGTSNVSTQQTETAFDESKFTFNLDYKHPFSEKWELETGVQYVVNDVGNDYAVRDFINNEWVNNENLTNIFEFSQNVLGAYATGAYEHNKWGVKVGLRVENTDLSTLLVNTDESNKRNFTNFFPTFHSSYKITERISVQAGYSRRIFRPRLWNLNPFFNIRNNFNVWTGNPNLLPELTDSYEVSSIYIFEKTSLNCSVYYRYTTDVVERISLFENNVNTYKPFNIGTNQAVGFEFNGKYTPFKWLTLNGDFNYSYFKRKGELDATSFDFSADQWSSELTTKFKITKNLDFELTGEYESREQNVQRIVSDNLFANMGVRLKILKGKGVFNFSIRDIFASRVRESIVDQEDFYIYGWGKRGRFITFGFSYGFGKGEAMEYSGQRRYR